MNNKKPKVIAWKKALGDQFPYVDISVPKTQTITKERLKKLVRFRRTNLIMGLINSLTPREIHIFFYYLIKKILPELRKEYEHWKPLYQNQNTTEEIFEDFVGYLKRKYDRGTTNSSAR